MNVKQTINQYYEMVNLQIAAEAMWDQQDRETGEYILSFRSTKFIEDHILGTNHATKNCSSVRDDGN